MANIIVLVIGLLLCFAGLKLVKLWSALVCFWMGVVIGLYAASLFNLAPVAIIAISVGLGLILAILGVIFSRFGMFTVCLIAGIIFAGFLATMLGWVGFIIGGVFGIIMAILAAIFKGPIVIIMTSLQGAVLITTALNNLIGHDQVIIDVAIFIVLAIVGIIIQFMMKSREVRSKELKQTEKLREHHSKEVEVEAARSLLDDDDDEDEEEERPVRRPRKRKAKRPEGEAPIKRQVKKEKQESEED